MTRAVEERTIALDMNVSSRDRILKTERSAQSSWLIWRWCREEAALMLNAFIRIQSQRKKNELQVS
jgi:hypothetical protein